MLVSEVDLERGRSLARSLTKAWPGPTSPRFTVESDRRLNARLIEHADVLIVDTSRHAPPVETMLELIALHEMGLPMMSLGAKGGFERYGLELLQLDLQNSPELIAGVLIGMTNRQGEVATLLHETGRSHQKIDRLDRQLERLNMELEDASRLQRDNLPNAIEDVAGGTVGTLWKPAGAVSGDLVTILDIGQQRTAMLVADAIGHGVPAAILSMMIQKTVLEAHHEDRNLLGSPSEMLGRLNESLLRQAGTDTRFATAIYGVFDAATDRITLGAAGHPAPIVSGRDGTLRRLTAQGPLLGIFSDETYDESTFQLEPGDRMVLYSDGVEQASQCMSPDMSICGAVAIERLVDRAAKEDSPSAFIDCIRTSLGIETARRGSDDMDDLTMLCLYVDDPANSTAKAA